MIEVQRYHDFSAGHRVYGHESKCSNLHGHNYRVTFTVTADELDDIGRVLDFSVVNTKLCQWLEVHWDHKTLIWRQDPWLEKLLDLDRASVVPVNFNPTAEHMAWHLVNEVGPRQLLGTGCTLIAVQIEETRKCSAICTL